MTAAPPDPLLACEGVGVRYGQVQALHEVSLRVASGSIQGLVGESGSGKTTLCRAVLGLAPLSSGSIRLAGTDIAALLAGDRKAYRRRVQMLLQDAVAALSPRMRIGRLLEEPLRIHRQDLAQGRGRLAEILEALGLPADIGQKFPHQVSGGQARRIGIARALLLQPELIVADEPTAGLDVSVQGEVLNLLLDLRREAGITLVLVSHNLEVVRRVADRVAVMYLGQVVEEAPAAALFTHPAHPYAAALLSATPRLRAGGAGRIVLHGELPSPARPPPGCRFHPRCPAAQPRCAVEPPALATLEAGRSVRCHFPFSVSAEAQAA